MHNSWDIFCSVVDNYGDIGVTWRLARQLVAEQGCGVRLWVDDLAAFQRLCPSLDPRREQQWLQGVEVCQWPADWPAVAPAAVVVEAFGCSLPAAFVAAMVQRQPAPLWLNLEYLSAEAWVAGCHGLPSLQSNGLQKFFFFPGFAEGTGGLLREGDLLARRQAFLADPAARAAWLRALGVREQAGARRISLFAYENPALGGWLAALADATEPTQLLVPQGRIVGDLAAWLGVSEAAPGQAWQRGSLQVQVLPFVPQEDYDLLLWACDFNVVRGEDSFIRAQWAGQPLLWHIYAQEEDAHLEKLDAFLRLYCADLPPAAGQALAGLWQAWNRQQPLAAPWQALQEHWEVLRRHAEHWCAEQAGRPDLAATLAQFQRNWLSCAA